MILRNCTRGLTSDKSTRRRLAVGVCLILAATMTRPGTAADYATETAADSPISYWQLNDTVGDSAVDSAGEDDGTRIGGITSGVTGIVGNAFGFDGTSAEVEMSDSPSLNFGTTGEFSLEALFYWDGGGSVVNNIIRKSNYPVSGPGAGYWLRIIRDSQTLEFFAGETVGLAGHSRGSVVTAVTSNAWHHVVATRDAAGVMKLYLDGLLVGSVSAPNADTTSSSPFTLGAWDDRFGRIEFFSGVLDDVAVYDSVLSAEQVSVHFNATMPPVDTDGDGVPDDEDAFPNDPAEQSDNDGDGIGDNADPDDDDDGLTDDEEAVLGTDPNLADTDGDDVADDVDLFPLNRNQSSFEDFAIFIRDDVLSEVLDEDLKNPKMRRPLKNKLTSLIELLRRIDSEPDDATAMLLLLEAIDKIENDLMAKSDGSFEGNPKNDWVVTVEGQELLFPALTILADALVAEL